jgi:CDP-2,3-bis-(O-geranylgeranyl)-sn-glycerol synthase
MTISEIFLLFFLAIPAFGANMIPVVAARWNFLPFLDMPIDGKKTFRGQRIFGAHKTWRGLVIGSIFGGFLGFLQMLAENFSLILFDQLEGFEWIMFGFLAGFGALVGDAVKSFFKRQVGIGSGRPFLPFDQIDYILGFLLFTLPLISWSLPQAGVLLLFALVLNPLINFLGYVMGIKKTFW